MHVDVGLDVDRSLIGVFPPWLGIEMLDDLDDALERLQVDAEGLGQRNELPLHELVPVVADDGLDERLVELEELELEEQAFAKVARADADGIERLHRADRRLHFLGS